MRCSPTHGVLMVPQRAVDEFAARQYGCFNVNQLRSLGIDRSAVARRVASGEWVPISPGVYAVSSSPPTWERTQSAALLGHPRAIVGGRAAARLHRIEGFERARPVVIVPRTGNARSPIARVIRSAFFNAMATERLRGFRTATPAETLLILAGDISPSRLEDVVEECLLSGRATIDELSQILDRVAGGRVAGSAKLRSMVQARAPSGAEDSTYLERLLERVLAHPEIPAGILEFPMSINATSARVDAYIGDWNLVVEADGRRWHGRLDDFERDRQRDNSLAAMGLQVIRFTYAMLKNNPDECVKTLIAVGELRRAKSGDRRHRMHEQIR